MASRRSVPGLLAAAALVLAALGCQAPAGRDVTPPNAAPVADAGPDRAVGTSGLVRLDGRASRDPDGSIASFLWQQIAGPPVRLSAHGEPLAAFTAPDRKARLVFLLTVTDDRGALHADTVRVDVRETGRGEGEARYVILLVGDGMHRAHETAASRYLTGWDAALAWHAFPYRTLCTTWDVDTYDRHAWASGRPRYDAGGFDPRLGYDPARGDADAYFLDPLPPWGGGRPAVAATDSASAATAMAAGRKTDAGNIAWAAGDPPGGALETLGETLRKKRGGAFGVVTTVPFSHATPAAFAAHNTHRGNYSADKRRAGSNPGACIAGEMLRRTRPDVIIGAGHPRWGSRGYLAEDDYEALRAGGPPLEGWAFVERARGRDGGDLLDEAAARVTAPSGTDAGRRLFGLFGGKGNCFEPPVPADRPGHPSFAREKENPSLARAACAALRVLEARAGARGFFLLVEGGDIDWANHANDYAWLIGAMRAFERAVRAVVAYVDDPANALRWTNTLVVVTSDHANSYLRLSPDPARRLGKGALPRQEKGPAYPGGEVRYGSRQHTNEPVTLAARGAGAFLFRDYEGAHHAGTRLVDNTHIYLVMARALGLR